MAAEIEESPERLETDDNSGRLIVSEHRGRYLWGAQFARGLRVLDAGCGTGYGLGILEEQGASQIVGVDISEQAVTRALESRSSERVQIIRSDLRELPFSDGEFDLVVCFEVIEHVDEHEPILDELARVLSADGILCISTPNLRVYPPGNPHHRHEYEPEEFAEALGTRFAHIALHRQTAWLASAILSDAEFMARGWDDSFAPRTVKMESKEPGEETFTVALAAHRALPPTEPLLTLGETFEVRWWQTQIQSSQTHADALVHQARQAEAAAQERSLETAQRLLEVEDIVAQSNARIFALEQELDLRLERLEALHAQIRRSEHIMAAMKRSLSWRLTAPLRALKRLS